MKAYISFLLDVQSMIESFIRGNCDGIEFVLIDGITIIVTPEICYVCKDGKSKCIEVVDPYAINVCPDIIDLTEVLGFRSHIDMMDLEAVYEIERA